MPTSQSFVDLRTSSLSAGSHTDDSVWPSFTDIMTVVVMIFLMSLVVILLKNVELVKSEKQAASLAQLKASENVQLESAVKELEQRIAQVQLQLKAQTLKTEQSQTQLQQSEQQVQSMMADIQALELLRDKLNQENASLAATKLALEGRLQIVEEDKANIEALKDEAIKTNLLIEDEKQQLILQLNAAFSENQQLASKLDQQEAELEALSEDNQLTILRVQQLEAENTAQVEQIQKSTQDFDALQAVYTLLQKDNRSLSDRISDAQRMIEQLETELNIAGQTIEEKQQQIETVEAEVETKTAELKTTTETLVQTRQEFDELEQKYLELVGPARSELNKYVVRVRYQRRGNQRVIEYAQPGDNTFVRLSRPQLNQRLERLKQQKADDLYVKVVIPSDSGLSYDEAWRFTQEILTNYDYYYQ